MSGSAIERCGSASYLSSDNLCSTGLRPGHHEEVVVKPARPTAYIKTRRVSVKRWNCFRIVETCEKSFEV